jgi:hypothetical protein
MKAIGLKTKDLYWSSNRDCHMPDEEPVYHNDYVEQAKKLMQEENLEERVKKAAELSKKYFSSDMVQSGHREEFITAFDFAKLGDLQKKVHDAHKDKKKDLSDIESDDLLKEILAEVLPKVGYGLADKEKNMHVFEGYMSLMGEDGQKALYGIKHAIKKGDGRVAVNSIIDSMIMFKTQKAQQYFTRYLLPNDHLEFRDEFSKYITKDVNKALKGMGELNKGSVSKSLDKAFYQYVQGKYDDMLKTYGATDQTKEKVDQPE